MTQIKLDESIFPKKKNLGNKSNGSVEVAKASNEKEEPAFTKLIVDVHEPEEIVEMLRKERGIFVEVRPLKAGDYAFSNVLIERKTINDFYNSIVGGDKHIWKQIFKLKRASDRPMLLIERWDPAFMADSRRERVIYGAMASIFLMGVSVIVIPGTGRNCRPFVQFLSYLFFSSGKKALSLKPVPKKSYTKKEILSDLISMLPMIGRKQANEIASRINSVEELCKKTDQELKQLCPHLGKKRIMMIRWVLNNRPLPAKKERKK